MSTLPNSRRKTALFSLFGPEYSSGGCYQHDEERQSQVISLLLNANANFHARNDQNIAFFLLAARRHLLEVATALLNNGANTRDLGSNTAGFDTTALAASLYCYFETKQHTSTSGL